MKKTTVYVDGDGRLIEGKVKRAQAYETTDGRKFHGNNAKMRAAKHEERIILDDHKLRYQRLVLEHLGISTDNMEGEYELITLFGDMGLVDPACDVEDCITLITEVFSLFDDDTLEGLHDLFKRHDARRFSYNKFAWDVKSRRAMHIKTIKG